MVRACVAALLRLMEGQGLFTGADLNTCFYVVLSELHLVKLAFYSTGLIDSDLWNWNCTSTSVTLAARYNNNCYGRCLRTCRRHHHTHDVSVEADNDPVISGCCSQALFSMILLTTQCLDNLHNPSKSSFYSGTADFLASAKYAVRVDLLALSHYHQQVCPGL